MPQHWVSRSTRLRSTSRHIDFRGFFAVDDAVRPGYQPIRGTVQLESSASEEQIQQLRDAVNAHCPVLDIITKPVPVELDLQLERSPILAAKASPAAARPSPRRVAFVTRGRAQPCRGGLHEDRLVEPDSSPHHPNRLGEAVRRAADGGRKTERTQDIVRNQ